MSDSKYRTRTDLESPFLDEEIVSRGPRLDVHEEPELSDDEAFFSEEEEAESEDAEEAREALEDIEAEAQTEQKPRQMRSRTSRNSSSAKGAKRSSRATTNAPRLPANRSGCYSRGSSGNSPS